jgi:hypothetical protein
MLSGSSALKATLIYINAFRLIHQDAEFADSQREEVVMPAISGSYHGKVESQASFVVPDIAQHQLRIEVHSGLLQSTDEQWNGVKRTFWITADTLAGNGVLRGYYLTERADGDSDYGMLEGRVSTSAGRTLAEGTYKTTGGTGGLAKITGSGTFTAHRPSPSDVEVTYVGNYELG